MRGLVDTLSFFAFGGIGCLCYSLLATSPCALAHRPQSFFARQPCRTD